MNINQAFAILQKSGGIKAARLITNHYKNISWFQAHITAYQLRRGMPVAKIIHEKWFFGEKFYTNRFTLDPRPDSETLVEAVIATNKLTTPIRILDLGTGTGCLIASLVKNIPNTTGVGIERSKKAASVAKRNMILLGLENKVDIRLGRFDSKLNIERFDIIVSNPPYIAKNDSRVNTGAHHDPKMALYASHKGLGAYKAISENAKDWIKPDGLIYLEVGEDQDQDVRDIFVRAGWYFINGFKDLSGIERVLCFSKPAQKNAQH